MADNPRVEELRRRVLADPAWIAFAALAEEYRRSGNYADAIETCRTGLQRHPSYLSARVTLGRALIETAQYDEARKELEFVLKAPPRRERGAFRAWRLAPHRRWSAPPRLRRNPRSLPRRRQHPLRCVSPFCRRPR